MYYALDSWKNDDVTWQFVGSFVLQVATLDDGHFSLCKLVSHRT